MGLYRHHLQYHETWFKMKMILLEGHFLSAVKVTFAYCTSIMQVEYIARLKDLNACAVFGGGISVLLWEKAEKNVSTVSF